MDCLLGILQQNGEGVSHNVAHKITKGVEYKIRSS